METKSTPHVGQFLPAAIILFFVGWGGLFFLMNNTLPTVGPRWLFFFLGALAITGTVLPAVAFLNRRFPSNPPVTATVILRQAIWVGIYAPTLVWLQIARVLTFPLALLLLMGFGVIEWLLRLRERSQWTP